MVSMPVPAQPLDAELEQAMSDYLGVSRAREEYATPEEYLEAEESAWQRLVAVRAALDAGS